MSANRRHEDMKSIRWEVADWELLATIAARVGLSRSAFIKRAAMDAASRALVGEAPPHYVGAPGTHNGGANTFFEAKRRKSGGRSPEAPTGPTPGGPTQAMPGAVKSAAASRRPIAERAKQPKAKPGR